MEISGIYFWRTPSGLYVGSAVDLQKRRRGHLTDLRRGVHSNKFLQHAFDKYGDAFQFEIVLLCDPSDLIRCEQYFIDRLNPRYNICRIAGSSLGIKRRPETKALLRTITKAMWTERGEEFSETRKRIWRDPVARARYVAAAKAAWADPQKRERMLASRRSPDAIAKLKAAQSKDEFKRKKSAAAKAQWADPASRARLLEARV